MTRRLPPSELAAITNSTTVTLVNSLYGTFTIVCIQLLPDYVDSNHRHTNNSVPIYLFIAVLLIFMFSVINSALTREQASPSNSVRIQSACDFLLFVTTLALLLINVGFAGLVSRLFSSIQEEQLVHSGPNHIFLWVIALLISWIMYKYMKT